MTTIVEMCSADNFCLDRATHFADVVVAEKDGTARRSRVLAVCDRHLGVLQEHATKRAAETGLTIEVQTRPIRQPGA